MPTVIRGSDNIDTSNVATQTELDVVDGQLLGVGQTWQNVTASRTAGVTYTNTTGKPIMVLVNCGTPSVTQHLDVTLDGGILFVGQQATAANYAVTASPIIVPNASTYKITGPTINMWLELR